MLSGGSGGELPVDRAITTMSSVLYDAVVIPCGPDAVKALSEDGYVMHFVTEAYKHLKAVGAFGAGVKLLPKAGITEKTAESTDAFVSNGVITTKAAADDLSDDFAEAFAKVLAKHRVWERQTDSVPA